MIIEYKYYPSDSETIEQALKVKYHIDCITFCIDFTIPKHRDATFTDPEEGGELEVDSQEILYVSDEDGIPIMVNKEQKFIIGDYIDYDVLDEACWEAWKKANASDAQDYAEYLYDIKHDR